MFWYEGRLIEKDTLELDINDPALLYGATAFTTMRVYHQSLDYPLTNWQAHCHRLKDSLQAFGWQMPDWDRLRRGAEVLVASFPVLRMVIFTDGRELILGRFLPADLRERQTKGIVAWVANGLLFRRELPRYKTGNYLGAWLALQKARWLGAQEAILIDGDGNWLETNTGNLWGYKDGSWWIPSLAGGILPGIIRSQLMSYLQNKQIPVQENTWTVDFVRSLEAIAYTNCVMEIIPFHRVFTHQGNLTVNPTHPALEPLRSYFQN
ncbi:MAG: aminotransferase class IV [Prochloron sp. SP5CPC1]|nr:aminotransferase class IV [Candidatus Paraprochloron terpiosi SP5CPC1]